MNESGNDGIEDTTLVKTHSVLESSIKLFRELQKKKTKHRGVIDHQVTDIRALEKEQFLSIDTKEHLVCWIVLFEKVRLIK